jgi:hypothetical protein
MKTYRGSGVIAPLILNLATRELSGQLHAMAALASGNRLGWLQSQSRHLKKNLGFSRDLNPGPFRP